MTKAIRIHENGGPEVLRYEDVDLARPDKGEVLIRHSAIGLNFIDVYYRNGLYAAPAGLPLIPGNEGAGSVIEVGEGVDGLQVGDRIAYAGPIGAYAEERVIAADRLVKIPDGVSDEQAAAMMLKGMTVEFLLRRTYPVKPGDIVLFHAAAGGVGLTFGQWAKQLGATVIGTAGSPDKMALAKAHGFDHVINYRDGDFVAAVREITGGRMCDVVYDSVGKDTFPGSLDCLKPLGMFVSFGQSSGPIPPFSISLLAQKGSLFATRPTLFLYIAKRADLEASAAALFDVVKKGIVKVEINQRHKLSDAANAHADLEGRRTTGTTLLIP
jgi:NADPH2:quinone reductase